MTYMVTNTGTATPVATGYARTATYSTIEDAMGAAASLALTMECDVIVKDNDDDAKVFSIIWEKS